MTDETQIVDTAPQPSPPQDTDGWFKRLYALRRERQYIEDQIREVLSHLRVRDDSRPQWGPCTRCGHTWLGLWANRPPRGCPNCHSTGWMEQPILSTARLPSDPPNPRWKKRGVFIAACPFCQHTQRYTTQEAADKGGLRHIEKVHGKQAVARVTVPAAHPLSPQQSSQAQPNGLTPPPKLEMVPSQEVRFADEAWREVNDAVDQEAKSQQSQQGEASSTVEPSTSNAETTGSTPAPRSENEEEHPKPDDDSTK